MELFSAPSNSKRPKTKTTTDDGESTPGHDTEPADMPPPINAGTTTMDSIDVDDVSDVTQTAHTIDASPVSPGGARLLASLPERPFQPKSNEIVKLALKTRTLHFQESWFVRFKWLHYAAELQGVLCHVCAILSMKSQLGLSKCTEEAFTVCGFRNWKKAIEKFSDHENSHCHRQAMLQLAQMSSSDSQPVCALLSKQKAEEQEVGRKCLLRIFTSVYSSFFDKDLHFVVMRKQKETLRDCYFFDLMMFLS